MAELLIAMTLTIAGLVIYVIRLRREIFRLLEERRNLMRDLSIYARHRD